jgi:hypothetical protein
MYLLDAGCPSKGRKIKIMRFPTDGPGESGKDIELLFEHLPEPIDLQKVSSTGLIVESKLHNSDYFLMLNFHSIPLSNTESSEDFYQRRKVQERGYSFASSMKQLGLSLMSSRESCTSLICVSHMTMSIRSHSAMYLISQTACFESFKLDK